MTEIVTRFAPSPTGFLHIGGARTALFNWLYAKGKGGKMLLRIEDTDRKRSTPEAIEAILDGLKWLGLDWDGDVVYQFARADRHRAVAEQLLAEGKAYRCYATPEDLDAMRKAAEAEGRSPRYDGRWRDRDPAEAPAGVDPVIRLKAPQDGETVIEDAVQGTVVIQNKELDDLVLLRGDGTPTYMLAVVVDDHDMGVTHVIRGVDHLTNAARQALIYKAMGWNVPSFSHIPLIHGSDGAKLSKRHGALGVEGYREMGFLPEALVNYLARLGWGHGNDEIFTRAQAAEWFGLAQIGRNPARLDFDRLQNLNGHYMRSTPDDELWAIFKRTLPYLPGGDVLAARLTPDLEARFLKALSSLKERSKTLVELLDGAQYLFAQRPVAIEEKGVAVLDEDTRSMLADLAEEIDGVNDWSAAGLEAFVRAYAERRGVKLGKVAQPLRVALTGRTTSPPVFDVLEALGRDESVARLRDQGARSEMTLG